MKVLKITMLAAAQAALATGAVAGGHLGGDYCQNAFFAADADADGMISQGEAEMARDAVYQQIDLDADGAITREEYVACTSQSAKSGGMGNADDMAAMDTNADGSIDPAEFFDSARTAYEDAIAGNVDDLTWAEKYVYLGEDATVTGDSDNPFSFSTEEYFAQVGQKYKGIDADMDGSISAEEYAATGTEVGNADRLLVAFDTYDTDGDGTVTLQEFNTALDDQYARASASAVSDGFTDASKGVPVQTWYAEAM